MDDEFYFPMTGHNIPGNDGYYARDKSKVTSDVKFRSKEKFPKKVLSIHTFGEQYFVSIGKLWEHPFST